MPGPPKGNLARKNTNRVPSMIGQAMQGLAFWMGYQHLLFRDHELLEGSITAELYRLITHYTDRNTLIVPEKSYISLGVPSIDAGNSRADLVVSGYPNEVELKLARKTNKNKVSAANFHYVLEVKRALAPNFKIKADIARLHKCLKSMPEGTRAFVLIVSQARKPRKINGFGDLVAENGVAAKPSQNRIAISEEFLVPIKIRRVCKASASFDAMKSNSAHYVVLIEVFA